MLLINKKNTRKKRIIVMCNSLIFMSLILYLDKYLHLFGKSQFLVSDSFSDFTNTRQQTKTAS